MAAKLEPHCAVKAKERRDSKLKQYNRCGNDSTTEEGRARDEAGALYEVSERSVSKPVAAFIERNKDGDEWKDGGGG
ncbi:hypothetical protein Mal64_35160 [Pseudobythopirellula maris]|uniref:Uncharacterized protein n=1 Tax=Pseudobythopirellula maris TaxID=2527991 RepID=A0A5C5ZI63_9BACT|nr:hypothetical protein [Pseudobythopirellula maris]TWT86687.1 hypothetical protein Mal64_35160 [Pseudobythopirellula maris]